MRILFVIWSYWNQWTKDPIVKHPGHKDQPNTFISQLFSSVEDDWQPFYSLFAAHDKNASFQLVYVVLVLLVSMSSLGETSQNVRWLEYAMHGRILNGYLYWAAHMHYRLASLAEC